MKKATKRAIVILIGILCLAVAVWAAPKLYRVWQAERIEQAKVEAELAREEELRQAKIEHPFLDDTVVIKRYQGKDYYVAKKPYKGEYDLQSLMEVRLSNDELEAFEAEGKLREIAPGAEERSLEWHVIASGEYEIREVNECPLEEAETLQVMNYEEYVDYCEEWRLLQKYTDPEMNYIVRSFYIEPYDIDSEFFGIRYEDSTAQLCFYEDNLSLSYDGAYIYIIPTDQEIDNVEIIQVYSEEEYEDILGIAPKRVPEPQ